MSQAAGELWAACDSPGPTSRYLTDAAMGDLFARRGGGGAGGEKRGWGNRKESGRGWGGKEGERNGVVEMGNDREERGREGGKREAGKNRDGETGKQSGREGDGWRGRGGGGGGGQTRTDRLTDSSYARIKV